ncbi:MAG: phospholipid carrier-dependent glycosyltransferase [Planctomycetes bacterium]|nr:phospholipid carrier-dependent glycosyltransferase [Planctomycetota bacterium]
MSEYPRSFVILLWALVALAVLLTLPVIAWRTFDGDEFEHVHGGWCVYHGQVPYRDYFDNHTPLLHFVLAGLFPLFGEDIPALFAARAMMALLCLVVLAATHGLAKRVCDRQTAALAVLLLAFATVFFAKGIEVRPDSAALALGLLAQVCLVRAMTSSHRAWCCLSGLAIGGSLMFAQKYVFMYIGLSLAALLPIVHVRNASDARTRIGLAAVFFAASVVPTLLTLFWFSANGAVDDFMKQNFGFNVSYTNVISPPYRHLRDSVSESPFVWGAGVAGIGLSVWQLRGGVRDASGHVVLLLCTLVPMAGMLFAPVYRQYLLQFMPLLAIHAAIVLRKILAPMFVTLPGDGTRGAGVAGYVLVVGGVAALLASAVSNAVWPTSFILDDRNLALVVCGLAAILMARSWLSRLGTLGAGLVVMAVVYHPLVQSGLLIGVLASNPGHAYSNAQQVADIRHVMSITAPADVVLDGWSGASVFRPHAYYYHSINREMRANLSTEALSKRVVEAMRERKCKAIVYDAEIAALPSEVQEFVHAHYRPTSYRSRYATIYVVRSDDGCPFVANARMENG